MPVRSRQPVLMTARLIDYRDSAAAGRSGGRIVYIGMAGECGGSNKNAPQGIRGRLAVYITSVAPGRRANACGQLWSYCGRSGHLASRRWTCRYGSGMWEAR